MSARNQFPGIAPWLQTAWDMRAAGNFIGGGSGTGLLLMVAYAADKGQYLPALLVVGLALVGLGLFSVFLEIGRPFRAMNVLLGGKYSWMTREAFVAAVLFPLGAAALLMPGLTVLVALPAAVYLYCQAQILKAAKGIPTWREPMIVPLILSTGVAEGAGAFLLLAPVVLDQTPAWAPTALLVALAARVLSWMVYRRKLVGGAAPVEAARVLVAFSTPFALGGNAIPVLMVVGAAFEPEVASAALAAAGLATMVGGWAMKAVIVTKAAQNQGFAIPCSPVRGAGRHGPGIRPGWR